MKLTKTLFFGALASIVAGDENDGEESPTAADPCGKTTVWSYFKITSTTQRDLMTECTEIIPTLWIDIDYPGVFSLPKLKNVSGIYLRDVLSSAGDSAIVSGSLTGVSFPALVDAREIEATNLKSVTEIDLPKLTYNGYKLELTGLPALKTFNGFKSIESTEFVDIVNTGLTEIDYNNMKSIKRMTITNNPNLDNIKFGPDSNITKILLDCNSNLLPRFSGPSNLGSLDLSQCTASAGNQRTTFEGVNTMTGDPEIVQYRWSDFSFYKNNFTSLAFSNLTKTVGVFSVWQNDNLNEVAFPVLDTVEGNLNLIYNDNLDVIITEAALPLLRNVSQQLTLTGHFSDITLPRSLQVAHVEIKSSNYKLNCSKFDAHKVSQLDMSKASLQIKCSAASSPTSNSDYGAYSGGGSSSSSSYDSSGPPSLPPRFIAAIVVSICSTIFWICVIWWLCIRRRKQRVKREAEMAALQSQLQSIGDRLPPAQRPHQEDPPTTQVPPYSQLPAEKPELAAVSVETRSQSNLTREEELEARERALEARERELAARESRGNAHELK